MGTLDIHLDALGHKNLNMTPIIRSVSAQTFHRLSFKIATGDTYNTK